MINSKKITIIISFLLLLSCGYKPIFSSSKANFSITEIKLFGKKNIGSKIKKNLNIYRNVENKNTFYSLKINADQKKNGLKLKKNFSQVIMLILLYKLMEKKDLL